MKKLKLIEGLIGLAGMLVIIGVIMFIIVTVVKPEGSYMDMKEPHWEINSESLQKKMRSLLPESEKQVLLTVDVLRMDLPVHLNTRVIMIAMMIVIGAYIAYILRIIHKIICDVRRKAPFNLENTKRVKRIGFLVTMAPLLEWLLLWILSIWISKNYQFDGLKLEMDPSLGWPVFVLGLLIVTLGVAFEQGQKIQEENQLTI